MSGVGGFDSNNILQAATQRTGTATTGPNQGNQDNLESPSVVEYLVASLYSEEEDEEEKAKRKKKLSENLPRGKEGKQAVSDYLSDMFAAFGISDDGHIDQEEESTVGEILDRLGALLRLHPPMEDEDGNETPMDTALWHTAFPGDSHGLLDTSDNSADSTSLKFWLTQIAGIQNTDVIGRIMSTVDGMDSSAALSLMNILLYAKKFEDTEKMTSVLDTLSNIEDAEDRASYIRLMDMVFNEEEITEDITDTAKDTIGNSQEAKENFAKIVLFSSTAGADISVSEIENYINTLPFNEDSDTFMEYLMAVEEYVSAQEALPPEIDDLEALQKSVQQSSLNEFVTGDEAIEVGFSLQAIQDAAHSPHGMNAVTDEITDLMDLVWHNKDRARDPGDDRYDEMPESIHAGAIAQLMDELSENDIHNINNVIKQKGKDLKFDDISQHIPQNLPSDAQALLDEISQKPDMLAALFAGLEAAIS